MSLKRWALLAAVGSHHNHHHNKQQRQHHEQHQQQSTQNATALITTTTTTMSTNVHDSNGTATPLTGLNPQASNRKTSTSTILTALNPRLNTTTSLPNAGAMTNDGDDDDDNSDISDSSTTNEDDDYDAEVNDDDEGDDNGVPAYTGHQQQHHQSGQTFTTYYTGGIGLFHQQNIRAGNIGSPNSVGGGSLSGGIGGNSYPSTINGNVNLLLGGAMLLLVTTIICVVCCCCYRNIKKRTEAAYRQQRQWLENDANMEIYSVEQCYETSGLFLGESTDGLTAIPALHHEPPPSYDAVVAMQEQQMLLQQQQQMHLQQLQRNSPPPGYRSSLDVSIIVATAAATAAAPYQRGSPDGMAAASVGSIVGASVSPPASDSNGNLSPQQQQQKHLAAVSSRALMHPILNMKRVLNAQSCCSLQRAEVENMFNAAAAAVAARSAHAALLDNASAQSSPRPTTPAMRPRKSLPTRLHSRSNASRYQTQDSLYRRGCPLCGKFRYEVDDDEDDDDDEDVEGLADDRGVMMTTPGSVAARDCHPLDCCWEDNERRVERNGNVTYRQYDNDPEASTSSQARAVAEVNGNANKSEECSCGQPPDEQEEASSVEHVRADKENGNQEQQRSTLEHSRIMEDEGYAILDAATPPSQRDAKMASNSSLDANANAMEDATDLHGASATATAPPDAALTTSPSVNLDTINENGIIRLDMSKIIDKTGLPTYEAALKLESSGYV